MRSFTPPGLPGRCQRCHLVSRYCICADVPTVDSLTRVVFVRHVRETEKTTNTARIAALALSGAAELVEYTGVDDRAAEVVAGLPDPWLLFPGDAPESPAGRPSHLVVLDGTWRQARRMLRRLPRLAAVPRLSLAPQGDEVPRLRRAPSHVGLSTLEAVAGALDLLEGQGVGAPLRELQRLMFVRVMLGRGRVDLARQAGS